MKSSLTAIKSRQGYKFSHRVLQNQTNLSSGVHLLLLQRPKRMFFMRALARYFAKWWTMPSTTQPFITF